MRDSLATLDESYHSTPSTTSFLCSQGSPQFIVVDFGRKVDIEAIQLMFQGGFVGKTCQLVVQTDQGEMVELMKFYPEDTNPLQICINFFFGVPLPIVSSQQPVPQH